MSGRARSSSPVGGRREPGGIRRTTASASRDGPHLGSRHGRRRHRRVGRSRSRASSVGDEAIAALSRGERRAARRRRFWSYPRRPSSRSAGRHARAGGDAADEQVHRPARSRAARAHRGRDAAGSRAARPARLLRHPAREAAGLRVLGRRRAKPEARGAWSAASRPTSSCRAAGSSRPRCAKLFPEASTPSSTRRMLGPRHVPGHPRRRRDRRRQGLGRRRRRAGHPHPARSCVVGRRSTGRTGCGRRASSPSGACWRCGSPTRIPLSAQPTRNGGWRPAACAAAP